jgi:hypothetical protein
MLNIPGHKGNANQNNTEISPPSSQNGYHQELKQQQMLVRMQCREMSKILIHGWLECKLVQPLWKAVWKFLKKNLELSCDLVISLLGHVSEGMKGITNHNN